MAEGSGHYIHVARPDLVEAAVVETVREARGDAARQALEKP